MSNIYIKEPPTNGKVLLHTSVGDIDIELWSKETPKTCRNFIQLCMEGYYNGTVFHRVVKEFIVQGGDPTGTGEGGESIYGKPFRDEFHSRLRFVRRGLVAMANGGPNDNGSQFFFSLGPAAELDRKHTIFGKIVGNTLYNMLKLTECETDENDRPPYPHKILKCEVLHNPYDDIIPRVLKEKDNQEKKQKKSKSKATKNFSLLSFGEEAEEDEEETNKATKAMKGKSKSSHDLLDDPRLSSVAAVDKKEKANKRKEADSESEDLSDEEADKMKERIKKKLKKDDKTEEKKVEEEVKPISKSEEYRREAKQLKKELMKPKNAELQKTPEKEKPENIENVAMMEYKKETEKYREVKKKQAKKGSAREEQTLAMLAKFQSKLSSVVFHDDEEEEEREEEEKEKEEDVEAEEKDDPTMSWLGHKLHFDTNSKKVIDANVAELDRYDYFDPRNPLTKRRREASKQSAKQKI